jgi:hypothetical protein
VESYGVPAWQVAAYAVLIAYEKVWCGLTGCPADLAEGMQFQIFDEELLESTPVAIDVDPQGRVWIAESDRMWAGVEDNRNHGYWLEDDLASRSARMAGPITDLSWRASRTWSMDSARASSSTKATSTTPPFPTSGAYGTGTGMATPTSGRPFRRATA